jgi:hypothetical protein
MSGESVHTRQVLLMNGTFIDLGWMKVPFIHHHRAHFPQPGHERPSDFAGALARS